MQTWLDFYVSGMGTSVQLVNDVLDFSPFKDGVPSRHRGRLCDGVAFQLMVTNAHEVLTDDGPHIPAVARENAIWLASLAPFAISSPGARPPSAFVLDRETVWTFGGADASPEVRRMGREEAVESGMTYLDLPHRSLMLGQHVELRALFVQHCASQGGGTLRFTAILTPPDMDNHRRLSWTEGAALPVGDALDLSGVSPLDQDLKDGGTTIVEVMRDCEQFALLTLAYAGTVTEDGDTGAWQALPHVPAGDPSRIGRKARQAARKFSLFRVRRMTVRRDINRPRVAGEPTGRRLGRRSQVRGHFRLQRHGPGLDRRRLIWIEPHERGPRDAVPTTPIAHLRRREVA